MTPSRSCPPLPALARSPELRRQIVLAVGLGPVSRIVGPVTFARGWEELRTLGERWPGAPVVLERQALSVEFSAKLGAEVVTVSRAAGSLDPGALESAVLQAIDARRARRLLVELNGRAAEGVRRIAAQVLSTAHRPCTVPDLAKSLGFSQSTLSRRCAALGLPGAKSLLSLARIFTVERLAEWSGQPSGAVAVALGFSDPSNYRRLVRRTLGGPPSAVREQGGARWLGQALLNVLAAAPLPTLKP